MVEEVAAAVSFSEVLNLLDVIRDWLQQVMKLRLQEKEGGGRYSRGEKEEMPVKEDEKGEGGCMETGSVSPVNIIVHLNQILNNLDG